MSPSVNYKKLFYIICVICLIQFATILLVIHQGIEPRMKAMDEQRQQLFHVNTPVVIKEKHIPMVEGKKQPENQGTSPEANLEIAKQETSKQVTLYPAKDLHYKPIYFVPNVIKSFRNAKIDWHDLIPDVIVSSDDKKNTEELKLLKLIRHEQEVTNFLTAKIFANNNYGPLSHYMACKILKDPCVIHENEQQCINNGFCGWCSEKGLCMDKGRPLSGCENKIKYATLKGYTGPVHRVTSSKVLVGEENPSKCKEFVPGARIKGIHLKYEQMLYHWHTDNFKPIYQTLSEDQLSDMNTHFVLLDNYGDRFLEYFGLMSKYCYRFIRQIPDDTCFVEEKGEGQTNELVYEKRSKPSYRDFLLSRLNLLDFPRPTKPKVGIISRRHKRFLLNEEQIAEVSSSLGIETVVLTMEDLTLYEQVRELLQITILFGIHGSGLINSLYMPQNSVIVQLMPYKVFGGPTFFAGPAKSYGVNYREWTNTDRSKTVPHWHFLSPNVDREALFQKGSGSQGQEFFTFWINQDTVMNVNEFRNLLRDMLEVGLNKELSKQNNISI